MRITPLESFGRKISSERADETRAILVEGQTEERFVKQVLRDHLVSLNLSITPTLLTTKVVKSGPNFKGGVTSFQKFESDLRRLLGGAKDGGVCHDNARLLSASG